MSRREVGRETVQRCLPFTPLNACAARTKRTSCQSADMTLSKPISTQDPGIHGNRKASGSCQSLRTACDWGLAVLGIYLNHANTLRQMGCPPPQYPIQEMSFVKRGVGLSPETICSPYSCHSELFGLAAPMELQME